MYSIYMLSIISSVLTKQHQGSWVIPPHPAPVVSAPVAELTSLYQYHRHEASENPSVVSVTHLMRNWNGLAMG